MTTQSTALPPSTPLYVLPGLCNTNGLSSSSHLPVYSRPLLESSPPAHLSPLVGALCFFCLLPPPPCSQPEGEMPASSLIGAEERRGKEEEEAQKEEAEEAEEAAEAGALTCAAVAQALVLLTFRPALRQRLGRWQQKGRTW